MFNVTKYALDTVCICYKCKSRIANCSIEHEANFYAMCDECVNELNTLYNDVINNFLHPIKDEETKSEEPMIQIETPEHREEMSVYDSRNSHQRSRWNDDEIAIVMDTSLSAKEVAKLTGRTYSSVRNWRLSHNIKNCKRSSRKEM